MIVRKKNGRRSYNMSIRVWKYFFQQKFKEIISVFSKENGYKLLVVLFWTIVFCTVTVIASGIYAQFCWLETKLIIKVFFNQSMPWILQRESDSLRGLVSGLCIFGNFIIGIILVITIPWLKSNWERAIERVWCEDLQKLIDKRKDSKKFFSSYYYYNYYNRYGGVDTNETLNIIIRAKDYK
jgi:hypothetical protein